MRKVLLLLSLCLVLTFVSLQAEVTVVITSPTDNSYVTPGATVMCTAEITTTADEEITDLRFYYNDRYKSRVRKAPWEYEWKSMLTGSYKLTALVTLADETEIWSEPVYFRCGSVEKGDRLFNGGFESGRLSPWTSQIQQGAEATFNVYDDNYFDDPYYLYCEITNPSSESWHIQLSQACPLDSAHTYDIVFMADAETKRTLGVGMQENQDPWGTEVWQEIEIDGTDEYMLTFESSKTDPTNQLRFNFGANQSAVFLDNIRVIDHNATSVKEKRMGFDAATPVEFELFKAYPNPFNMSTTIQFRLTVDADVRLEIFNMNGQLVTTLANGAHTAGSYTQNWDGTDVHNNIVPSGVYFYRLTYTANGTTSSLHQKMMLVK